VIFVARKFRYGGRRYSRRPTNWRGRARSFSRGKKWNKGGFGVILTPAYLGGVAAGLLVPTLVPYQELIMTALAVLPVRLPYGLKLIAQGYVGGRLVKPFMGNMLPNLFGSTSGSTGGIDFV
jgi:hypothetical protein